ncbi:M20 family metallopeptidase [Adhaeretor mobilis]|uniref:Acetylornithine deacetylase n=1 Tax=Adhaeretor mobilis TaxID=1930276 RepID=A0A517N209_9BACT|nr:M20 family metallopeptidase [Adhaeretor mobilis]QDT01179.1 Acetylornithine deacetylase [Adhaeretor mobilis]
MSSASVQLLEQLIALPSVNPLLTAPDDPDAGEGRVTDFLQNFAQQQGWPWLRQSVHPGRDNFLALVGFGPNSVSEPPQGGAQAAPMLFEAHQDTVSTEGMTCNPFDAKHAQGRLYGRGACDVKGGMAAMLVALAEIGTDPDLPRPVLFASTINEECGFTGVRALAELWSDTNGTSNHQTHGTLSSETVARLKPRAAVVAEPTELDVVVSHRGVARWQVETHGRAAHSSQPSEGANAIYAMASIVRAVQLYESEVLAQRPEDPRCGRPTVSVTTFHGGTGANTVPEIAAVNIDRRLSPEETPEEAFAELSRWIEEHAELLDCTVAHQPPWMQSHGLAEGDNLPLAKRLSNIAREVADTGQLKGVPYGANAATLATAGISTVVFGPGSIAQAHTADEWIEVEQLEKAVEIYRRLALDLEE